MPIAVEVLPPAQFAAWVASKGGTMPGASPPKRPDSTAASPVTNPAAGAGRGRHRSDARTDPDARHGHPCR